MIGTPAVAISYVNPGSPAEIAGLQAGDAILEVDGEKVFNANTLVETIYDRAGEDVVLLISRNGERQTLTVRPRLLVSMTQQPPGRWVSDWE